MSTSTIPTPADVAAQSAGDNPPSAEHAAAAAATLADPAAPEAPAQETDWKAEARKWERLAKDNKAAAARLVELEEASKTEEQKRAEEFAALQSKVAEYETREQVTAWKAQVSEETGVPAAALAGDSLEALQAHAEILAPLIAKPQNDDVKEATRTRPVPALGNQPAGSGNVPIHDQIAAAEEAGNKPLVAALKASLLGQTN